MPTFVNTKYNKSITTDLSMAEIAEKFAESAGPDHWLWYWLAQFVQEQATAPARKDMIAFLADSFTYAIGMGLRKPMIRLHWKDHRYKIYLSRAGSVCIKTGDLEPGTHDPRGNEHYMGCLRHGRWMPNKDRTMRESEEEFLSRMSCDPVGFMAEASKDMDRCCYCNLPLEDARSKEVGYGPVCAERWGLPWGSSAYGEKVPSFAEVWGRASVGEKQNVRGMCEAIRRAPYEVALWEILGDALEEAGFVFAKGKRPQPPKEGVVVPAA